MKTKRQLILVTLFICCLNVILIPIIGKSQEKEKIRTEGLWGPVYGIHVEGITGTNRMIYDNDWFNDIIDAGYAVAKHKLGELDLRGIIVTADFYYGNGRINKSIDNFINFRNNAIKAGIKSVPDYLKGANAILTKPASGKISETFYTRTDGSDLIIAEARQCTPENPLIICVGGPATTVATALIQDPSIADKIFVLMCDLTDYNNKDTWSIYIVAQMTRFFAYPFILNHGYSDEVWGQLPDNNLCDHYHTSLVKHNAVGDGALLAWFFNTILR